MTRFLREHDLPEGDVERRGEVLGRLERQLPSGFPDMVADQEFTSLIDGLVALPRSGELLLRLREGAALPAAVRPEPVAYSAPPPARVPSSARGAARTAASRADGALLRGVASRADRGRAGAPLPWQGSHSDESPEIPTNREAGIRHIGAFRPGCGAGSRSRHPARGAPFE